MAVVLTNENFEAEVLKSDIPVLVDFYADWCGPCKAMAPVVETLASGYAGKAKVAKINIDDNEEMAVKYGVMTIPTFMVFKNGVSAGKAIGLQDAKVLADMLDKTL